MKINRYSTCCYLKRDEKYLLLFRNKKKNDYNKGKWIGVGGGLENNETPDECAIREVKEDNAIVFVHSREPVDIARWAILTNAKTLFIRRPAAEDVEHNNHADKEVFDYDYDYEFSNDGDIMQLHDGAIHFINWVGRKSWRSTLDF